MAGMERRAPLTIPNAMLSGAEHGVVASPMPWASDYAAPTPSFPLTPQAQRDKARQVQAAQHEAHRAAVVLQCLCRSHNARARLLVLRGDRVSTEAALVDAEAASHIEAAAATQLQSVCRAHLVQQLRAWFTASVTRAPRSALAASTAQRANPIGNVARARELSDRRERTSVLDAEVSEVKSDLHKVTTQASEKDITELTQRIRSLERQLGRGLGQPTSAARTKRRRRRSRTHTPNSMSSSSLRVKARPTVATFMSTSAADVHVHSRTAVGGTQQRIVGRSKSAATLGSSDALEQFSAEWSQGSVDGWAQWLPRHRWFQGFASQIHALHSLADPLAGADDDTRAYIREYVERELSYPHRTSGHRMDGGNAVESAVAHSSAWKPGSASISSRRDFGAPPDLPRRVAPTSRSREHWVTRLSRGSPGSLDDVVAGSAAAAHSVHQKSLQVTLRQDVGGTTGFGVVLQCEPASSLQDRRLQPQSNTSVTAVTPGSDASVAGVVAGMAVLSVNGNQLRADTSVSDINKIFEEIVGLPSVMFEFETKGQSTGRGSVVGFVHGAQSSCSVNATAGWCARAQSRVVAAGLGQREVMVIVLWDGGGTSNTSSYGTAASSMCEHAAHQLADVLAKCFKSGLVRDVACVEADMTSGSEDSAAATGHMWSRAADEQMRRMVPEHTSPTGGHIAWSAIAAKLTGWSRTTSSPFIYSGRGCQDRWEEALDPHLHLWASLRPPQLSIWWCNGAGSGADGDVIVPEQLYVHTSEAVHETTWPSEDEIVTLVGARVHHHIESAQQDTADVVSALHKQVRQQMRSRRELHTEIDSWQAKNKELERKCARLAAEQLAQKQACGAIVKIYNGIRSNPLRPRAAPSRETTPAGAAAADLVPGLGETTAALLPVTDVTAIPMPVLSAESPSEG